jgi:hypothetical protein
MVYVVLGYEVWTFWCSQYHFTMAGSISFGVASKGFFLQWIFTLGWQKNLEFCGMFCQTLETAKLKKENMVASSKGI